MFGVKQQVRGASIRGKSDQETEPSRILKLKECCDMLIVGGYFRVRIPTLSPFDKVVGGMVWSITASNVELDVDIIFTENSTIGQKIKLSEQLVRALITLKGPPLQSHQIQGLDYDSLLPVIRFLVRKVLETRQLTGDLTRLQSIGQFSKNYIFPEDAPAPLAHDYLGEVRDHFKPTRVFKQSSAGSLDPAARTTAALMEYGEKLAAQTYEDEEAEDKRAAQQAARGGGRGKLAAALIQEQEKDEQKKKKAEEIKRKAEQEELKRLEEIKGQLSQLGGDGGDKVSAQSVGDFVGMQADTIKQAAADYEATTQQALENKEAIGKASAAQAHQRQLDGVARKIAAVKESIEKKIESFKTSDKKVKLAQALLQKKLAYRDRILRETAKLEEMENQASNKEILAKLKALVLLNESLKAQEAQFKNNCKLQRAELMDMLKKLESGDMDDETKRVTEIENIYEKDLEKLNKLRAVLAKKNQEIARINRLIDEIPTRAELLQYERRFVELYEMVSEKLVETRKYFAMYNTLDESHSFMAQEVKLLNNIVENFPKAMKTKQTRETFLAQFQKILEGVEKQKEQVEGDYQKEKTALDALKDKYSQLLEKQRNYFKMVKEFQEECTKNEKLASAIERLARMLQRKKGDEEEGGES